MKNTLHNVINAIKDLKNTIRSDEPLPPILAAKFRTLLLISASVFVSGIIFIILCFSGIKSLIGLFMPFLLAMLCLGYALFFKYRIIHNGYTVYEGVCVDHRYSNFGNKLLEVDFSIRRYVSALIIEKNDQMIKLELSKLNEEPPIGSIVRWYVPNNAREHVSREGLVIYSEVFGYEIVADAGTDISEEED